MKKLLSIIISLTIMLAVCGNVYAATPLIDNAFKITDTQGRPVPAGQVFTYEPGTTTPKVTYSDEAGTIPHPNPVPLDTSGKEMIYGSGSYTIDVKDMFGAQVAGFPKNIDAALSIESQQEISNSYVFKNVAELRAWPNTDSVTYDKITLPGYFEVGDGGGGPERTWLSGKPPGTYIDNGGSVIVPGDGSAAWVFPSSIVANVLWYGAIADGTTDLYSIATNALSVHGSIYIPKGIFASSETIEIATNQSVHLLPGADVRRLAAHTSTDPVFWLKNSFAALYGDAGALSHVRSEKDAPFGVVRIGHKDLTESHNDVLQCRLHDLYIHGQQSYGKITGTPDQGIAIYNPLLGGKASFFHMIDNIHIVSTNTAIGLHGYANANFINDIFLFKVGNNTSDEYRKAIHIDGAQENNIHNIFHHASPSSITMWVEVLDNTVNGGGTHTPSYNDVSGMISEQSGAAARQFVVGPLGGGVNNTFKMKRNVALDNIIPANYEFFNSLEVDENKTGGQAKFLEGQFDNLGINTSFTYTGASQLKSPAGFSMGSGTFDVTSAITSKSNATPNASAVSFVMSNRTTGATFRHGFVKITVSGDQDNVSVSDTAWFLYSAATANQSYPTDFTVKDSGGDTGSFTVGFSAGTLTISSTFDNIVATVEYSNATGDVAIQ